MLYRCVPVLVLALSATYCSQVRSVSTPDAAQRVVIKVAENRKYKLEATFSGEGIEVGDRIEKVIDSLTVRSKVTGRDVKYERPDGPSESDAHAYFTDVWSPNDEWLLLPLNRFSGFCILRASNALDSIQNQRCTDTVRVRIGTPPKEGLWHEFEKWDGNDAFVFKAGLYGDSTRLKYEILSGRLTALDSNFKALEIEGENTSGRIAIDLNR